MFFGNKAVNFFSSFVLFVGEDKYPARWTQTQKHKSTRDRGQAVMSEVEVVGDGAGSGSSGGWFLPTEVVPP